MANGNGARIIKYVGIALVAGIILDSWSGANSLLSTGASGSTGIISALKSTGTTSTTKAA